MRRQTSNLHSILFLLCDEFAKYVEWIDFIGTNAADYSVLRPTMKSLSLVSAENLQNPNSQLIEYVFICALWYADAQLADGLMCGYGGWHS